MKITWQNLKEMLNRNPQLRNENQALCQIPGAQHKSDKAVALGKGDAGKAKSVDRITVRIIGFLVRPHDSERFSGGCEYLIDGLRHAKLIPDDSWWDIRLITEQEKIRSYAEERTEIEIEL